MTRRTPAHLRAVTGDRKTGETAKREARSRAAQVDVATPTELPASAQVVWDRVEPSLRKRGMLNDENADLLAAYCVAVAANQAAAAGMFNEHGRAVVMVDSRDRGPVKNPVAQIFRDTSATMRQLAAVLHLDELGLGKAADDDPAAQYLTG